MVEFLYEALASPFGTIIQSSDPERLRQRLYAARREAGGFEELSFITSPTDSSHLWIVKRSQSNDRPA